MDIKLDQMMEGMSKLFCEHFFMLLSFANLGVENISTSTCIIASNFKLCQLIEDDEKITWWN